MNAKKINEVLAKVSTIDTQIVELSNKKKQLLIHACENYVKKGESLKYHGKDDQVITGKVLYHIGQQSLTLKLDNEEKPNVPLAKLVLTAE